MPSNRLLCAAEALLPNDQHRPAQVDIAETEADIDGLRKQFEAVREAVDATAGDGGPGATASEEQERRKKRFMLTRQGDRLRTELASKEAALRTLLQSLQAVQRPPSPAHGGRGGEPEDRRADGAPPPPPVVPEAVRDMCDYLGINVFQAPPPRPRTPLSPDRQLALMISQ